MNFTDLAEHSGTLVTLIGALCLACTGLIVWFGRIVAKVATTLKSDIFEMIKGLDGRIAEVWREIGEINKRQMELRAEIPRDYLRVEGPGYKAIMDSLKRIEDHSEQVARDLRERQKLGGKS